jgi:hypothetical protein
MFLVQVERQSRQRGSFTLPDLSALPRKDNSAILPLLLPVLPRTRGEFLQITVPATV